MLKIESCINYYRHVNVLLVSSTIYLPGGPMIPTRNGLNRSLHVGILKKKYALLLKLYFVC